jgi:hypothetical protein
MGGWDETVEADLREQERKYNEIGLGEFMYLDATEGAIPARIVIRDWRKKPTGAMRAVCETDWRTSQMKIIEMPLFIFRRRHDIELEARFTLAGILIIDVPKQLKLKRRRQRMLTDIIQQLTHRAQSGQMPDDAIVFGWRNGCRPPNADDITSNNELIASWAKDRLSIVVRVDPRNAGLLRIDSDMARQLKGEA